MSVFPDPIKHQATGTPPVSLELMSELKLISCGIDAKCAGSLAKQILESGVITRILLNASLLYINDLGEETEETSSNSFSIRSSALISPKNEEI